MKLSKLYSNETRIFEPVFFQNGLNVVIAEIRLPQNRDKDTHNLGKTTLGRLLDFCLLAGRDNNFFLYKRFEVFSSFVFYLELHLSDGSYLTIRRGVDEATKISFKRHSEGYQNFLDLGNEDWDHSNIPFDRAKSMLDGMLDLRSLAPWDFRQSLGYLLRLQDDYQDVFKLSGHLGRQVHWKPYLAHVLGFNADLIVKHYEKEDELSKAEAQEEVIRQELGGTIQDLSKIEGKLLLKRKEAEKKQVLLDAFDFRAQDKEKTKIAIDDLDERIGELNAHRYSLSKERRKIISSLDEDEILFDPEKAENLFQEAGVLFAGQIKKDFEQLISFNKAITEERRTYLQEERKDLDAELAKVTLELNALGKKRSEVLSFLSSTDVFVKYRETSDELVNLKADIETLDRQRGFLHRLQDLRKNIRLISDEKEKLQAKIEEDVEMKNRADSNSLFSTIRVYFNEIVEEVIGRKALLGVSTNRAGHLEFKAEILDEQGNSTSADMGHTYRKLLCVAFDMAIIRAHLSEKFPKFIYHDGIFESLDDRKKINLTEIIRKYNDLGLQHIITLIDSELPKDDSELPLFNEGEIVLTLHDEGAPGRIFKMNAW